MYGLMPWPRSRRAEGVWGGSTLASVQALSITADQRFEDERFILHEVFGKRGVLPHVTTVSDFAGSLYEAPSLHPFLDLPEIRQLRFFP